MEWDRSNCWAPLCECHFCDESPAYDCERCGCHEAYDPDIASKDDNRKESVC